MATLGHQHPPGVGERTAFCHEDAVGANGVGGDVVNDVCVEGRIWPQVGEKDDPVTNDQWLEYLTCGTDVGTEDGRGEGGGMSCGDRAEGRKGDRLRRAEIVDDGRRSDVGQ